VGFGAGSRNPIWQKRLS